MQKKNSLMRLRVLWKGYNTIKIVSIIAVGKREGFEVYNMANNRIS